MTKNIEKLGNYTITDNKPNDETIYSLTYNKYLKCKLHKSGYYQIRLQKNNKKITRYLHRLIAEAFIPNPDNKPCVDHINGDRTDNRIENLRWCTRKENSNFPLAKKNMSKAKKGRIVSEETKQKMKKIMIGKNVNGKLSKRVNQYDLNNNLIASYPSMREAERQTGYAVSSIVESCKPKTRIIDKKYYFKKEGN